MILFENDVCNGFFAAQTNKSSDFGSNLVLKVHDFAVLRRVIDIDFATASEN